VRKVLRPVNGVDDPCRVGPKDRDAAHRRRRFLADDLVRRKRRREALRHEGFVVLVRAKESAGILHSTREIFRDAPF